MRIVFIGPPGAGKGTQCLRVSRQYDLAHISSGEMLRASKGDTEIGRLIAGYIDGGNLAPDDLVMQFMIDRLRQPDCADGCLFDGFPRTVNQAVMLEEYLSERADRVSLVINLVADEKVLIARLLDRAKVQNRVDDTPETIASRLDVFHDRTEPVIEFYEARQMVRSIDAMRSPDDVYMSIRQVLDSIS